MDDVNRRDALKLGSAAGIAAVTGTVASAGTTTSAMAAARQVNLVTFLLETTTDAQGSFFVPHGLEVAHPDSYRIKGITVAVQHQNLNWHTLEISNQFDNRFWWNQTFVQGVIGAPTFANRPVRVIVFAEYVVG